ncbi:MAG: hypothetical protein GH144_00055 [Clostridia bacterium]|jgi:hypothetical protein|nr:hypothetical protein [Clostridia bacterium]
MIFTKVGYRRCKVKGKSEVVEFLYWLIENKKELECHVYDGFHYKKLTPVEFWRFVIGPN